MHLQLPPNDHAKRAHFASDAIADALLDLRKQLLTYARYLSLLLSASSGRAANVAHGFITIFDTALLIYNVTSEYARQRDSGMSRDCFGGGWGVTAPVMSARDGGFRRGRTSPTLSD